MRPSRRAFATGIGLTAIAAPTIVRAQFTDAMSEAGFANFEKFGQSGSNVDNTPAIQNAFIGGRGSIVIPPGGPYPCSPIKPPSHGNIYAPSGRSYYSFFTGGAKGTGQIVPLNPNSPGVVFDVRNVRGLTTRGLLVNGLGGDSRSSKVVGMSGGSIDLTMYTSRITSCYSGLGVYDSLTNGVAQYNLNTTIAKLYSCVFTNNALDGVTQLVDSGMFGGELTGNKRNGYLGSGVASVSFNEVRNEWNEKHGYDWYSCQEHRVVGEIIDANKGVGVNVNGPPRNRGHKLSSVTFRRNGRADNYAWIFAHLDLAGCDQMSINDCTFIAEGVDFATPGAPQWPTGRCIRLGAGMKRLSMQGNILRGGTTSTQFVRVDASPTESISKGNIGYPDVAEGGVWSTF